MKLTSYACVLFFAIISSTLFSPMNISAQEVFKTVDEPKGLPVGAIVSDFEAIDQNGKLFNLHEELMQGPMVLIFYRGQWCPVCNRYLSNLQDSLQFIYDKGARVIAVSPEKPEYLKMTEKKTKAEFTLLYDESYKIAKEFDVLFLPEKETRDKYNTKLDAHLQDSHSDSSEQLPIPATYIIDKNSKIIWRQFNPNYKIRSTVHDILVNLPSLEK